ncbi:hypothetical protein JYU34_022760, partial [Plutella xylostella]
QRCKERLNTLAISVMNQWPGVRLRVAEGWDEDDSHLDRSLHYEGRAVDVSTSDRDHAKYGMLARLAVEAGFDWVYYESRSYIHLSVKTESSGSGAGAGCFPGGALVRTRLGPRPVELLAPGDQVLAVDATGKVVYSEVLTFLDRDPSARRRFVRVTAESGAVLTLTPSHLLLLAAPDAFRSAFAADVVPGDVVLTRGSGAVLVPSRVVAVDYVELKGVYAPLTSEGTILVDDVLASCYAVVASHGAAHGALAPLRWLAALGAARDVPRGVHWYASFLYSTAKYLLPKSYTYG